MPSRPNGKSVYVRELGGLAAQWKGDGRVAQRDMQRKLIKHHGRGWLQMSAQRRAEYERNAAMGLVTPHNKRWKRWKQRSGRR